MAHQKQLLVEGPDDRNTVIHFMRPVLEGGWPPKTWPVEVKELGGSDSEKLASELRAYAKQEGLRCLGIVLDADTRTDDQPAAQAQYLRIKQALEKSEFPGIGELPEKLNPEGLIHDAPGELRIGVWIMPNNEDPGMLEDFLLEFVPQDGQALKDYANEAVARAKQLGAPFKPVHRRKAEAHTYLAWQDEPGKPFGQAIQARFFETNHELGRAFQDWFINLFQLTRIP